VNNRNEKEYNTKRIRTLLILYINTMFLHENKSKEDYIGDKQKEPKN
jgi:hypothetical protein